MLEDPVTDLDNSNSTFCFFLISHLSHFTTSLFFEDLPFPLHNCYCPSLFMHLPKNVNVEQLCWAPDLFLVDNGGWGEAGKLVYFSCDFKKQNPTWLLLDRAFVSMPALSVMSVGTCTVVAWWGSSVGQDDASHDGLGYILPKHSQFHVSFIKTLIPKLIITFLALITFYRMKRCQVFFIREWCTSTEKLLSQKSQTIPRSLFWDFK